MKARERIEDPELRSTTQEELGLMIDDLTQSIQGSGEEMEPRLITASDLVRRMRPFLVYN